MDLGLDNHTLLDIIPPFTLTTGASVTRICSRSIVFALFLFISFSNPSHGSDTNPEKDLQTVIAKSDVIIKKIDNAIINGASVNNEINSLKNLLPDIKASRLLLERRFALRMEKIKDLGSMAVERHQIMQSGFTQVIEEYIAIVEGLPQGAGAQAAQNSLRQAIDRLKALIERVVPKSKRPILGALPYKHLNYPSQEPGTAPAITPAYKGGNVTVTPGDLKGTEEAPLSVEIASLAQSLNWNPVSIYEYVKNNIETEWYRGCMKGAEETLHQKSGNDCDQC